MRGRWFFAGFIAASLLELLRRGPDFAEQIPANLAKWWSAEGLAVAPVVLATVATVCGLVAWIAEKTATPR